MPVPTPHFYCIFWKGVLAIKIWIFHNPPFPLKKQQTEATIEDVTSNIPEKTPPTLHAGRGLATAELVFPLKSVLTVIAGIPKPFLPVHGLETLSLYCCQFLSCILKSSLKKLQLVIIFDMIILMQHWHAFTVVSSIIPRYVGIMPLLGNTILQPIPKKTFPFIQMILPFHNNLLVVLEMELHHLPLDLHQTSLMLL